MADPQKQRDAVAKALELEEGADDEKLLRKLQAIIAFLAADSEDPAPDAPAEEAEAARDEPDAVAASDEPEEAVELTDETPDAVEATAPDAEAVDLQDPAETDPAAGELGALVTALAEMTGMDEASTLAALREKLEEVAAVLSSTPDDGMEAEEPEQGMSRAALEASRANTKAAQAKLARAIKRIEKLEESQKGTEAETRNHRVELAIRDGHLTREGAKAHFILARSGGADFEELMADAAANPEVPTATIAAGHGTDSTAEDNVSPTVDDDHPEIVRLSRALGNLRHTSSGQKALDDLKTKLTTDPVNIGRD